MASEQEVEIVTNALMHLPIKGAALQLAARQVLLALEQAAIPPSGEPEMWQHRLRMTNGPADDWTEWRDGKAALSEESLTWLTVQERALYAAPPAPVAIDEAVASHVLDVAADYILEQYGIGALHHPVDRARIRAALNPQPNGGA